MLVIRFLVAICLLLQAIEAGAYPIPYLERLCSHRTDIVLGTVLDRIVTGSCDSAFVEYKVAVSEVFKGEIKAGSTITIKERPWTYPYPEDCPSDRFNGYEEGQYVLFLWKPEGWWQVNDVREVRGGKRDIYYQDLRAALGLAAERQKKPFISEEVACELAKAYAIQHVTKVYGSARNIRWTVKESRLADECWNLSVSYWIEVMSVDKVGATRTYEVGFDNSLIRLDAETGEIIDQMAP